MRRYKGYWLDRKSVPTIIPLRACLEMKVSTTKTQRHKVTFKSK